MKITKLETFFVNAGWRPWIFLKISTDEGLIGWSEMTDSHGSPKGIRGVIEDLSPLVIGKKPEYEKIYWDLYQATRQSPGSIVAKAIGGIENALLDIKGKELGVPVYELFGGPTRTSVQCYWSHCGTTRARAWEAVGKPMLDSYEAVERLSGEVSDRGFQVLKTNVIVPGNHPWVYMPGFQGPLGQNGSKVVTDALVRLIEAFKRGGDAEIVLDLNFNFKTEGVLRIAKALPDLLWLEVDCFDPKALAYIRQKSSVPICSGENLYGRGFRPFFEEQSMDIASVDVIWNGFAQSKKIADMAEVYEVNVAPHNYYSHLATFISAQFCAAIPNVRMLEIDIDDVPWKDELTPAPEIVFGSMITPKGPGWGCDVNEDVLRKEQYV